MGKKIQQEILRRLDIEKEPTKKATNLYIDIGIWDAFKGWCADQDPPQKPSRIIEEMLKMLLEEKK